MRAVFYMFPSGWPRSPLSWVPAYKRRKKLRFPRALIAGMKKEGVRVGFGKRTEPAVPDADLAVIWSWKAKAVIDAFRTAGRPVLVMEQGYIYPRYQWCSLAVNGLNGRGAAPTATDGGERWNRLFADHLKPWRETDKGYSLVIGQVPGDASLDGADIAAWVNTQVAGLLDLGHEVVFRPHPRAPLPCPKGATLSTSSLTEDLAGAGRVVCFNSTTTVEAILAGVPTVITDPGSVAYRMGSHDIRDPLVRPDRTQWCHDLAWRHWSLEELADGTAWRHLRQIL
jgi:hypothetical protein